MELAAELDSLVLVAGRYEGVDERLIEAEVDEELSIGDYVLSGGELAAMVVIDAVRPAVAGGAGARVVGAGGFLFAEGCWIVRTTPGPSSIRGPAGAGSIAQRGPREDSPLAPEAGAGQDVERRPDLLEGRALTPEEEELLAEYRREQDEQASKDR